MSRSWTIGGNAECDLVVSLPTVSGRHCRLTELDDGFLLEDLGSTNGTYVNGVRIGGGVRVSRGDAITLGQTIPMPWPPVRSGPAPAPTTAQVSATARIIAPATGPGETPTLTVGKGELVIGRNADCDRIIDLPMVSGRHARLVRSGGQILLKDLGSSNGTYVNGRRIEREETIRPGDVIGLGSYMLVLADDPRVTEEQAAPSKPTAPVLKGTLIASPGLPPSTVGTVPSESGPGPAGLPAELAGALRQPARLGALLAQAPLAALLIVGAIRVDAGALATPEGWASASRGLAAILSGLGLAAVWFGLSNAAFGIAPDPAGSQGGPALRGLGLARIVARFAVLGALCVVQCTLAWLIVANGAGLRASVLPALGLLVLASTSGLALGLTVMTLVPRPVGAILLPVLVLPLWLLGGQPRPLPAMPSAVRVVAGVLPTRWAFEGLLLLEADRRPPPGGPETPEGAPSAPSAPLPEVRDLAEDYFPAESQRMGVGADAIALAAMLIGLSAAAAFISEGP